MKKSMHPRSRFTGYFLFVVLLFNAAYGQPQIPSFFFSEVHLFPVDSSFILYYSYRIPNSRLVFEKDGDSYNAGFRIAVEIIDSNQPTGEASSNFVTRQIKEKEIIAKNFEQTNDDDIYTEGMMEFKLTNGDYSLIPIITDLNSQREIKNNPITINSEENHKYLSPIIVNSDLIKCNAEEKSILANFEGNIPFSEEEYDLIIPLLDTTKNDLYTTIINNEDTVFNGMLDESFISSLGLEDCDGKIMLKNSRERATRNFILKKISNKLYDGNLIIYISTDKTEKPMRIYTKQVEWYNKPFSLLKPEFALKMLKYIESDSVVDEMLSNKSSLYPSILFDYWKKYDPTPNSSFNQLMNEYYSRVDYAATNFSTITGKNGVDSDRGKIFIQFGKPKKIERTSNEHGKIVETWSYDNPDKSGQKKFIFIDERGTGEFSLMNG